jgi:chloramphenicol-sensitive protein RarD
VNKIATVPPRAGKEQSLAGLIYVLGAFLWWGLVPVYFKAVAQVDPLEVLAHRVVWSAMLLAGLVALKQGLRTLFADLSRIRWLGFYCVTGVLLSANWLVFIWAIKSGRLIESSLGYYINPLVSVLLGFVFLGERLNPSQWLAVAIAGVGVAYQVVGHGSLPWVSLVLALTFGFYGLLRKKAAHDPIRGLLIETLLMTPVALVYLCVIEWRGLGVFGQFGWRMDCLLAFSGVATSVPLVLFLEGVRRIRLATVGLIQYVTPTLQLLLAVWIYGEPFSNAQGITFGLIWLALVIYAVDALRGKGAVT